MRLLRPLALNPHDSGVARAARMLMGQAGAWPFARASQ